MKILWLAWKDTGHPEGGGAEVVLWQHAKRMVDEGHDVTILTCGYKKDGVLVASDEIHEGVRIIRVGTNRYAHSFQALAYYVRHLRGKYDLVIETVNTAPYFAVFFERKAPKYLLYHQLAREVWHYETKAPLSHLGYHVIEPVATRIMSWSKVPTITVSDSTRNDLRRFGFKNDAIHNISLGIEIDPVKDLTRVKKFEELTMLSFGTFRAMKRTIDQIAAFEAAKASIPKLQLKLAGSSSSEYGKKVLQRIAASPYKKDIEYLGKVSEAKKISLMQRSHIIVVTSIKEGWGLIVTEANSQGTPAVVYDVDGLRDSVRDKITGKVTKPNPMDLAAGVVEVLKNKKQYDRMRQAAWLWSKEITFDKSYKDLKEVVKI